MPGKAIKLFFSTLPKTLSPRFNLALVHRVCVFNTKRKKERNKEINLYVLDDVRAKVKY